jgi:hypothetical protein
LRQLHNDDGAVRFAAHLQNVAGKRAMGGRRRVPVEDGRYGMDSEADLFE